MKKASLQALSILLSFTGSALADLEVLALPVTTPNSASVTIAAGEAVEIHASSLAQGGTSPGYLVNYVYGGSSYQIGAYSTVTGTTDGLIRRASFPGPATVTIFSAQATTRAMIVYRIVPASDYAKNESHSDKFMAAAAHERTGTLAAKQATPTIVDAFAATNPSILASLQK